MMGISTQLLRRGPLGLLAALVFLGAGCTAFHPVSYDYFAAADERDPWSRKIRHWQDRELHERGEDGLGAPASVAEPGQAAAEGEGRGADDLLAKYRSFRADQKRELARGLAVWIQEQAQQHYVPDGPVDRWATLAETFRGNGDDCDGLELLTLNLLRESGFTRDEVYRAIVYRRSDGQHHMVTLWFEDRDDPWVLDPTGAMTSGMPRMSEVAGWVPLKVFSESDDFTVERVAAQ